MFLLMRKSRHTKDVECVGRMCDEIILTQLNACSNFEYYSEPAVEPDGDVTSLDQETQSILLAMLLAYNSPMDIASLYLHELPRERLMELFPIPKDDLHKAQMFLAGIAANPENPLKTFMLKQVDLYISRTIHANKEIPQKADSHRRSTRQLEPT